MWSGWIRVVPAWCWWLLLVLVVGGGQQVRVMVAQGDLAAERDARRGDASRLGACRETRGNLLVQVGEQNQALAGLRQAEQERAARAQQAQQQARQQAEQDYQAANRLQQERTGGDACAAAESVIDRELGL